MNNADFIVSGRWILPIEPAGKVLEHHVLVIRDGRIAAILPSTQAKAEYPDCEWIEKHSHVLMPGFVNAHGHAAMTLLRGLADDLPLKNWLQDHIWPAEHRYVSPDFVRDGAELAIAEMIRGGTTCFADMYFFPDVTARAANRAGMRAAIGLVVIEFPTAWASDVNEYIRKGLAVRDENRSSELTTFFFAPHAPYTVSDDSLERVQSLADELDMNIQMHIHETASEVSEAIREHQGERPLSRLDRLGFLQPNLMAVHMTELSELEIARIASTGVSVIHCPESNLKLASGVCPIAELMKQGVNIAIGTDGAASNNDLDMLGEIRTAAMLAKITAGNPSVLPAEAALAMATINGAKALGLDNEIGSLVIGKSADFIAIDMDALNTTPVYDPISALVYAAHPEQVSDAWIAGQRVLHAGKLTTIDETDLRERVAKWRHKIAERKDA